MQSSRFGFSTFAKRTSRWSGSSGAFALAVFVVLAWACTGPMFDYSDTWQLVINTGTTIITFLMVFLIQNTQNRDSEAMQAKLDELIRAVDGAHNAMLNLEDLDEEDLLRIRERYGRIAARARERVERGRDDTGVPKIPLPMAPPKEPV